MEIRIEKKVRRLTALSTSGEVLLSCPIALGRNAYGKKMREGDGRTPEGIYYVCLKNPSGKYGRSLGISYPGFEDAKRGGMDGAFLHLIATAQANRTRPPWGSALGGEICIHGGGALTDWTAGCIALNDSDMNKLYAVADEGCKVTLLP